MPTATWQYRHTVRLEKHTPGGYYRAPAPGQRQPAHQATTQSHRGRIPRNSDGHSTLSARRVTAKSHSRQIPHESSTKTAISARHATGKAHTGQLPPDHGSQATVSARHASKQSHRGQIAGFKPPTDNHRRPSATPTTTTKNDKRAMTMGVRSAIIAPDAHSSRPPDGCRRPSIRHPSSFFLSSLPVRPAQAPDRGRQSNHPHPQCPRTDAPGSPEPQASCQTPRRGSWPPAAQSGIPRRQVIRRA